jgi:hypothetical protein
MLDTEFLGPFGDARYKQSARDICDSGTHLASLINDIVPSQRRAFSPASLLNA